MYWRRTASSWIFGFCIGFFEFGFLIWLPTTRQSQGYQDAQSVNYPMLINFFAIPSAFFALYLLNKGGSKLLLTVYPLIAGVLLLLFGLFLSEIAASPIVLVLVGGGIFFFGITLLGIFPPYSSEIYPTEIYGTGSGWATGISRVGSFLGPMVGGLFLNWGISPQVELVLFGLCLLLGFLMMFRYGVQTNMLDLETISPHVDKQQPEQVETLLLERARHRARFAWLVWRNQREDQGVRSRKGSDGSSKGSPAFSRCERASSAALTTREQGI
jgi:putative MFS transporter